MEKVEELKSIKELKIDHKPDKWVLVKSPSIDSYIILSGWSGAHMAADIWRLSTMVSLIEDIDDHYIMRTFSGSVYKCFKASEGFTVLSKDMFEHFKEKLEGLEVFKVGELTEITNPEKLKMEIKNE